MSRRTPIDFGDYYAGHPPDARFAPVLRPLEWHKARRRRERLRTLAVVAAAIVLPVLVAWVVVHALVGL